MEQLKIEYVDKSELKMYANNAKIHTAEQVDQIKKSIEEFGFNDPVAVWHDNEIIEGHGRLLAAMEMDEIEEVPIIRLDDLTDEQRKAYMLIHNKLTMNTDFDDELLDIELDNITDIDMSLFGFDFDDEDEPQEIIEDSIPEEVETLCKEGDLWILGEHRLICGDSTDVSVIDRLMDGVKADCVFTDPPYGMKKESEGVLNDNLNFDDLLDFNRQWIPLTFRALKDNGSWYCWGIDEPLQTKNVCLLLNQSDKTIANALGYKDGRTVNHWRSKSQFALPTRENYEALREYGKSVLKDYDFLKKDYDELKKDFYEGRSYFDNTHDNMNNVWHFDRAGKDEREHTGGHATPKPIALCSRAIKSSSREGEIVLDVFGGSGSTLIACEQFNRKCCMCELDTHYCDVIVQRYINYKGNANDVVLIRDGKEIPYRDIK